MAAKRRALKPFQIEDGQHIAPRRATLVAHQPRVGKTNCAIHACDLRGADLVVVICPPNVRSNWREAILEFRRKPWVAWIIGDNYAGDVYEKLKKLRAQHPFRHVTLILDESHRFKNMETGRTRHVYGPESTGYGGVVQFVDQVILLTGTPLPNNPMELYPMLRACAPELLVDKMTGRILSKSRFTNRYCKTQRTPFGMKIVAGRRYDELKKLLFDSGFCIRRTRKEVFGRDLQEPQTIYVDPPRHLSEELKMFEESEEGRRIMAALADGGIVKLAKLESKNVSRMRRVWGLAKVPAIADLVSTELDEEPDSKIIIGFWHTDVGNAYMQALRKYHPLMFNGKTPGPLKTQRNKQFQNEKKHRVIVAQLDAAGLGLDFSAARNLIFAEWSFVGIHNEQFMARIFNMNVDEPGFIRFAVLAGSCDRHIASEAARKLKIAERIFDS